MFERKINLALQGGGALGALTWGVLDRLLEEKRIRFDGISGSSAGAMNAAALAHGLAQGGKDGGRESARRALDTFWTTIGGMSYPVQMPYTPELPAGFAPSPTTFLLGMTRFFSPYQMNPFDINPLRRVVERTFDFERLRRASPVRLFIGATHARSGALHIFREHELTAEHLLASACLPAMHHAVHVDGEAFWDGGYTGNPPIYPLVYDCKSRDVMIVMLLPLLRPSLPASSDGIRARVAEIHFNVTFLREMRSLTLARRYSRRDLLPLGRLDWRLRAMKFHLIDTEDLVSRLTTGQTLNTSLSFLLRLKEEGRKRADAWLAQHRGALGWYSSVDIDKVFGGPMMNGVKQKLAADNTENSDQI